MFGGRMLLDEYRGIRDSRRLFQTPVFVMTDLDLGMNNWMADPFTYPDKPISMPVRF